MTFTLCSLPLSFLFISGPFNAFLFLFSFHLVLTQLLVSFSTSPAHSVKSSPSPGQTYKNSPSPNQTLKMSASAGSSSTASVPDLRLGRDVDGGASEDSLDDDAPASPSYVTFRIEKIHPFSVIPFLFHHHHRYHHHHHVSNTHSLISSSFFRIDTSPPYSHYLFSSLLTHYFFSPYYFSPVLLFLITRTLFC